MVFEPIRMALDSRLTAFKWLIEGNENLLDDPVWRPDLYLIDGFHYLPLKGLSLSHVKSLKYAC